MGDAATDIPVSGRGMIRPHAKRYQAPGFREAACAFNIGRERFNVSDQMVGRKHEEDRIRRIEEEEERQLEEEKKAAESLAQLEEEQRRKEEEEYQKWQQYLVLENQGTLIDEQKDSENLLERFVEYIRVI